MSRTAPASTLVMVPYREVRHDRPEDCIHHESIAVRGREYGWSIPAHRHEDLHQLQWLRRGAVVLRIDGECGTVQAPALVHVAPGCVHGFDYTPESQGEQLTVPAALLRQSLADAPHVLDQLRHSFVLSAEADEPLASAVASQLAAVQDEFDAERPGRTQALVAWTTLLFVQAARWQVRRGSPALKGRSRGVRDVLVQRFRSLVDAHFHEAWALKDYAQRLGVTADHLSRACRAAAGQHALEILHERRVREAKRRLAHTGASVGAVAAAVGYPDPAYFSRFFARATGLSPLAYRLAVREGQRP